MCTIGALRPGPGEAIVFKNKDFARPEFDDHVVLTADMFGVRGLATFDAPAGSDDRYSGICVGANAAGLLGADADVNATGPAGRNYDELLEIILTEANDVAEAVRVAEAAAAATPFWHGNLVLADDGAVTALEVRGSDVTATTRSDRITRSNHHLGFAPGPDESPTSRDRLAASQALLEAAAGVADILALQQLHEGANNEGRGGICSHAPSNTVYSYTLHCSGTATTLHVTRGQPCIAGPPTQLELPLGAAWSAEAAAAFRVAYPSAVTAAAG